MPKVLLHLLKQRYKKVAGFIKKQKDDIPTLLENLRLITPDGELKAAAIYY